MANEEHLAILRSGVAGRGFSVPGRSHLLGTRIMESTALV